MGNQLVCRTLGTTPGVVVPEGQWPANLKTLFFASPRDEHHSRQIQLPLVAVVHQVLGAIGIENVIVELVRIVSIVVRVVGRKNEAVGPGLRYVVPAVFLGRREAAFHQSFGGAPLLYRWLASGREVRNLPDALLARGYGRLCRPTLQVGDDTVGVAFCRRRVGSGFRPANCQGEKRRHSKQRTTLERGRTPHLSMSCCTQRAPDRPRHGLRTTPPGARVTARPWFPESCCRHQQR